jgi:hypothetical protein
VEGFKGFGDETQGTEGHFHWEKEHMAGTFYISRNRNFPFSEML